MVFWDATIFHVSMQNDKEAEHDSPLKNQIWTGTLKGNSR